MGGGEITAYCAIEMVEFPYEFLFPISNAFGLVFGRRDRSRSNFHLYHLSEESLIRQVPVIFACLCVGIADFINILRVFQEGVVEFPKSGTLGHLFGKVSEMEIAL